MMMKKLSAAALALMLSLSTLAVAASADEKEESTEAIKTEISLGADFVYNTGTAPAAPTTVSAVKRSNGMELKWNAVSGANGYLIRAVHPSGESMGMYYEYVTGGNTTSFFWDYMWSTNKDWDFFISAYSEGSYGQRNLSTTASKFTVTEAQTVTTPEKVEFTGYSKSARYIELDWRAQGCDGYEVSFKGSNAVEYAVLGTTTETHAKISQLQPNSTYYVRIRGYKNNGSEKIYGAYSEEKIITTDSETDNTTAPAAVNFKKVVSGEDSLRYYWDPVSNCDGYQIYFNKTGDKNDWEFVANVNNSTLDYRFTGLDSQSNYWISIRAYKYNNSNVPVYGEWVNKQGTTDKKGSSSESVSAPMAVNINTTNAAVTYDTVTVHWNGVKCDGYEMWINETGYNWKQVANVSGDSTSYRFNKLKPNHQYWFTVCAYNKLSNGDVIRGKFSDNYTTTTKSSASAAQTSVQKPARTEFTSFSRTSNAIRLNWSPVSCDGYFIYRYNYNTKAWERISVIRGGNITTKRFANLNADTTYVYKIRAYKFNTNGTGKVYSEYSSPKYVTTKKK